MTGALFIVGLTGCEGPGPEYQTPMPAYSEQEEEFVVESYSPTQPPSIVYEEIYREQQQQNLRNVLFFDSGSMQISPTHKQILKEQASYLKQNPHSIIRVEGHSDNKGEAALNHKMAHKRALETAKFLRAQGIPAKRIETVSMGAKSPAQLGKDPRSQGRNRRVELVIVPGTK